LVGARGFEPTPCEDRNQNPKLQCGVEGKKFTGTTRLHNGGESSHPSAKPLNKKGPFRGLFIEILGRGERI